MRILADGAGVMVPRASRKIDTSSPWSHSMQILDAAGVVGTRYATELVFVVVDDHAGASETDLG
jgi:hypothetical protein